MLLVKQQLLAALAGELETLSPGAGTRAAFENPKVAAHGDYACTAAMQLAKPLKLNPVGLKLLALLMQKSPHVVRREVLEEALWGDDCPDSDSLRSHVHQLRQVIDKPFGQPLLHTVHGVGYRLAERVDGV